MHLQVPRLAQLVEGRAFNPKVAESSPASRRIVSVSDVPWLVSASFVNN